MTVAQDIRKYLESLRARREPKHWLFAHLWDENGKLKPGKELQHGNAPADIQEFR